MPVMVLAAQVWVYWVALVLLVGAIVTVIALVAGYLVKVVSPQYPKRSQR
jgi:hypothetical protein